jgi:cobalamin biosynthesis protein CbiG
MTPRWLIAGVGCTRGTTSTALVTAVREAFSAAGLHIEALRGLASVRAKEDESGLFAAAEELDVPLLFAGDEQVETEIAARGLAESEWVRASIGVGAACEPAALWAAGPGSVLVQGKIAGAGITVALARGDGGAVVAAREERWKV